MATSFQKRARIKVGQIPGTRPSLYNNQLLVSTGIPSLDAVIGGGLAVGTVLLVEEDKFGSYSRLMLKYFVAEGILSSQTVFLSSASESPHNLIQELPAPIETDVKSKSAKSSPKPTSAASQRDAKVDEGDEKMKIAWRYQSQPKLQKSTITPVSQFGHYYDLTKVMDASLVENAQIFTEMPNVFLNAQLRPVVPGMNPNYAKLFEDIKDRIEEGKFGTAQQSDKRSVLRIAIHSLGSPLWSENAGITSYGGEDSSLTLFLIGLRAALRSALAVAMVTVPSHLFHDTGFVHRIRKMSDSAIRLESFAGSDKEKNPVFRDYHGLLHLIQLPRLNSLIPPQPELTDLAFKLKRKKFTIERLHLPPELSDTPSRSQESKSILSQKPAGGTPCGNSQSKLDF